MLSNKQFDIIYLFEGEISLYSVKNYPSVWFVSVKEKRLEVVSCQSAHKDDIDISTSFFAK